MTVNKKFRNKLSDDFVNKISQGLAGFLPNEQLDNFFKLIESEINGKFFPKSSESNLLRIILSMYDKVLFINDCVNYPHYVEILIAASSYSNYLTDIIIRDPGLFYWIVNPSVFTCDLTEKQFKEDVKKTTSLYKSFNAKINSLRILKRKEILRIGVRDIYQKVSLEIITNELSIIARCISVELFKLSYEETFRKHNLELPKNKYTIVALGKLGGNELNYSSDIDLIIFYDKNTTLKNGKEYFELLNETIKLFIENASSISGNGFIYRIDLRLRPYGRNSPLTGALIDFLNYYENRGEDWERQMLIKAGFIGGSNNLYKKFINYLTPFIFPLSLSSSPSEQIKKIKSNIEHNLDSDYNIKLTSGGIRDIEFSIQALQLLNGGRIKQLQTGNTLKAIRVLKTYSLLTKSETKILTEAYIFYRKVEHFLQLMNDTQTHIIPDKGELLEKLYHYLEFKSANEFKSKVAEFRKGVTKIYNSILGLQDKDTGIPSKTANVNFKNKEKSLRDYDFLKEGKGLLGHKQFDQMTINSFQKIESELIGHLKNSQFPDIILQNFVRVIRSSEFPSIWYSQLTDKKLFGSFIRICEFSQKSVDLFAEDAELQEIFLTKRLFQKIDNSNFKGYSLKAFMFILSTQFTLDLIDHKKLSILLTKFLRSIIIEFSEEYFKNKLRKTEFLIAAMGSFGTGEITFASDIDLIFIVLSPAIAPNIQKKFLGFLELLRKKLNPYKVDCRLRPEGKSSQLVWDLNTYRTYISTRARTWELSSFCKLNFIYGNKKILNELKKSILNRIKTSKLDEIKKDIMEMRKKLMPQVIEITKKYFDLKKSRGGLIDIGFIIQYLMIAHVGIFGKLIGKNTFEIIVFFKKSNLPAKRVKIFNEPDFQAGGLDSNYYFLKDLEIRNQVLFNSSQPSLPLDEDKLKSLSIFSGFSSVKDLEKKLNKVINSNYSFYKKYLQA
jgi:[glutamine synthetase] adenylyltransferase / [glutamine synthetase]-adenylyl-L-tyrosine phosphorylase